MTDHIDDAAADATTAARSGVPVRGVLFDLGGTLFSYEAREGMGQASAAALRRLGLDPDDAEVRAARRTASAEVHTAYASRPSFLHADLFRDRIARTAELMGVDAPDDELARFTLENSRAIIEHMPPRHDAAALLTALADRGIYRAVVSNADASWLEPVLRRHGFDDLLDDWTSSEEADSCKPDSRIYEYALAKSGLGADEVLFVGDSLQHDVAGAQRCGIRSVLIGDPDAVAPLSDGLDGSCIPDHVVQELSEIVAIVDELGRS